jgi:cytidylate kinase
LAGPPAEHQRHGPAGPTTDAFCRETERVLLEAADAGDVVVLGRAAAIILRDRPGAVHVRLDGPEEARVFQAMQIEQIDEEWARRRQRNSDRARMGYVKHFYQAGRATRATTTSCSSRRRWRSRPASS